MAVAFALIVIAFGASLIWMGWRGKGWSDIYGMLTGSFPKKGG